MHDDIKPFPLEGTIGEKNMEEEKSRIEGFVRSMMKDENAVELLDIDPNWTLNYNFDKDAYDFKLTMYGVEVEDSWRYSGIMNGRLLEKSTVSTK